jgi:predicted nucleotidyltransferase
MKIRNLGKFQSTCINAVCFMKNKKYTISKSRRDGIAESISSYLLENMKSITTAYLFGSFIAADSFSDIDLGVIIKTDFANLMHFEFELENRLEKVCRYSVDARVLNRAPLSFCQNVIRHGKVILDRDPNLRADFEGNIRKQYFDFSRFRKQYLREAVNAPV